MHFQECSVDGQVFQPSYSKWQAGLNRITEGTEYLKPAIVNLSRSSTPVPNNAFQPFWSVNAHEMVGMLDDN
jgi:hypothetical protein